MNALMAGSVNMSPDGSGLPGGQVIQQLTNGIGQWALIASLVGLVIGAAMWALGHYSQNDSGQFSDLRFQPKTGPDLHLCLTAVDCP